MMSTDVLIAVFIGLASYYSPKLFDPVIKPKETTINQLSPEYDFIIVGAGSAGSVLANRLSEISDWKILLMERGFDETPVSKVPIFLRVFRNKSQTWKYTTVRQENACQELDGVCDYPTGKVLGGSSSINAMLYARGSRHDYDEWEQMGCTGWSYDNLLPYFIKSENTQVPELKPSNYHGTKGPLVVQHSKYRSELTPSILNGAEELGIPNRDYNGKYLTGADVPQLTVNNGERWSASSAYLIPARGRSNLHIVKNVMVHKVLIDETNVRATGVEYSIDGVTRRVKAKREVILSSGAINTPKILTLSGIGPKRELERLGIPIVKDLPVGENLQDHGQVRLGFKLHSLPSLNKEVHTNIEDMLTYLTDRKGIYTYNSFAAMIFFSTGSNIASDPPDVQIHVVEFSPDPKDDNSVVFMIVNKAKPESRGTVKLLDNNPQTAPLIDPKYFSTDKDLEDTLKGLETSIKLMKTSNMSKYQPEIYHKLHPQCRLIKIRKEFLKCVIKHNSGTVYHPAGTARMGPTNHPSSVVDPNLRIIGIENLRVVDASIMPKLIRANTNAPTMMIAEKASDIIKDYYSNKTYYLIS